MNNIKNRELVNGCISNCRSVAAYAIAIEEVPHPLPGGGETVSHKEILMGWVLAMRQFGTPPCKLPQLKEL